MIHTCIQDGGTPNRTCEACEAEKAAGLITSPLCPTHHTGLSHDERGYWWCAECREAAPAVTEPVPPVMPAPVKGHVVGHICGDHHERITYQEDYCPLCKAIAWGRAVTEHATETFGELELLRDERVFIKQTMFGMRERLIVIETDFDLLKMKYEALANQK